MKLILATNNKNKVVEMKAILGDRFEEILSLKEAGYVCDPVEDGSTFEENALIKARAVAELTGCAALADDSGLCVEALNDGPGIRSARYASTDETDATDEDNRHLLLRELAGKSNRRAYYRAAVALVRPDGSFVTGDGRYYGEIIDDERGQNGFGYDCIFYVPGKGKTFAQISPEEKNADSHRSRALRDLLSKL